MTFPWKYVLLILIIFPSCNAKKKSSGKDDIQSKFIATANDPDLSLQERIIAAREAYKVAADQENIPALIQALRISGRLYMAADSAEEAMAGYRMLIQLADSARDGESIGAAFNNMAMIFSNWSIYDSALYYHRKATRMFERLKDTLRIVQSKINTGIVYNELGFYETAFSVTIDAANKLDNMNPSSELASAYITLGNTLKDLQQPKESLDYHQRAIEVLAKIKDSAGIAGSFNNIGNVYKTTGKYDTALKYYLQSLELLKKHGPDYMVVTLLDNIAYCYMSWKQYDLAEQYGLQALALRNIETDKDGWLTTANRLTELHLARNELAKAKAFALQVKPVAADPLYRRQELQNALLLKDIYAALGNHAEAIAYSNRAMALKDSLFNSDMSEAISKMNIRFQTEQQQKKLEVAQKNTIIQNQQINNQRYTIFFLGSTVILLLVISYLLYSSNKQRQKSRERAELLMAELNHRVKNNIQMISAMLNLQTQTAENDREAEIIESARRRIHSIGIVHNLLYQKTYDGNINISVLVERIVQHLTRALEGNGAEVRTELFLENIQLEADQAISVGLIVNEWLTNIYKYGKSDIGPLRVKLSLAMENKKCALYIIDSGREWDMHESRNMKKGLGLLLTDMLIQQLEAVSKLYRQDNENFYYISFHKL
jgi:two-component system, sensor histidine kinase PdtaS